jgi:hypothetical protein
MIKAMQADVKVGRQKGHGKGAKLALLRSMVSTKPA